jgi:hypothetical protein
MSGFTYFSDPSFSLEKICAQLHGKMTPAPVVFPFDALQLLLISSKHAQHGALSAGSGTGHCVVVVIQKNRVPNRRKPELLTTETQHEARPQQLDLSSRLVFVCFCIFSRPAYSRATKMIWRKA